MARQVASLYGVLTLRDSDYRNKLAENRTNTASFSSQLTNIGGQMQSFGGGMTAMMAPIGLALGVSSNNAREFDSAMANVNSIIQLGATEAAALNAEVLAFGSGNSFGGLESATNLYQITSGGITDTATAMEVLNQSVLAAEAGQAQLGSTTTAMLAIMQSYGLGADGAGFASDVLARTVQVGSGTMDEFGSAIAQVAPLAALFGIEADSVGGALAYLTSKQISASQSGTFMRSMITTLLNPTADLQTAITALGFESGRALLESEGLVGAYQMLAAQNGGLDGLITNQEALTGSIILTGEGASEALTAYSLGLNGATEAMREQQEAALWFQNLQSAITGVSTAVGQALNPALEAGGVWLTGMLLGVIEWIQLNPELTSQIVMIAGALVVAGPVIMAIGGFLSFVGVVVGGVTTLFGILTAGVGLASVAFVGAGGGVAGMGAAVLAVLGPFGIMILAVGALVAWMNTREGGLIGSLNEASVAAQQLAFLGLWAVNEAATNAISLFGQLTGIIDQAKDKFDNFVDTATGGNLDNITNVLGQSPSNAVMSAMNPMRVIDPFGAIPWTQNAIGNMFGGERARGGPVSSGRSYLVGENGPEMFTPSVGGGITPNNELGASGGDSTISIGSIVVNANTEAEGRVAGRAALDEIMTLARSRGIAIGVS